MHVLILFFIFLILNNKGPLLPQIFFFNTILSFFIKTMKITNFQIPLKMPIIRYNKTR